MIIAALALVVLVPAALFWLTALRARNVRRWSAEGLRCPQCGMHNVWKSRPKARDGIYEMFACVPYRCRGCGNRFYFREG